MSAGAIGGGASMAAMAALQSSQQAAPTADAGGAMIELLKTANTQQGEMALQLITAGLEMSFGEQKMDIAQQIIDVYA